MKKKKFENNWLSKSLESLEKDYWQTSEYDSNLIKTCKKLRKKQLKTFEVEDLRIMIGQNIGLRHLIPLAINVLENNIFSEGDFYEGDLLKSVLTSDKNYWISEKDNWNIIYQLFNKNIDLIKIEANENETGRELLKAYKTFSQINQ